MTSSTAAINDSSDLLDLYTDPETCPTNELESVPLVEESAFIAWQQDIPRSYLGLSTDELDFRIQSSRLNLGSRLVILGHHYQRDEVIKYADYTGDSFKLAQHAEAQKEAEFVLFCGVHFMAESADILTNSNVSVLLPNMAAGCSMADMARPIDVFSAWGDINNLLGEDHGIIPITYMNSAASLKSFVGEHEGIVCTSSNALKTFEYAFDRGEKVFFFPDQHLGRNTAYSMGISLDEMVVWEQNKHCGGLTSADLERAKVILWEGHCSTHQRFSVQQIMEARSLYKDVNIIVHPECSWDVVQAADASGSTEKIIDAVSNAPTGSIWGIGTEINLVHRLADQNPDKHVFCLDPVVCPCSTMYRIHPAYLAWVLESLENGHIVNQVLVDQETRKWSLIALERMLELS